MQRSLSMCSLMSVTGYQFILLKLMEEKGDGSGVSVLCLAASDNSDERITCLISAPQSFGHKTAEDGGVGMKGGGGKGEGQPVQNDHGVWAAGKNHYLCSKRLPASCTDVA